MTPVFATPLALLGLAALPALAAIYFLHTRSRLHPVSSLLLWSGTRVAADGGRRLDRSRFPLTFWLELLLLALLALAAGGPHVPVSSGARPLVVVLDDSVSMRAGGPDSPRARAGAALLDELRGRPRGSVRFVLAGDRPQVLGGTVSRVSEVEAALAGWTCAAGAARLDTAVALALALGDPSTVLVLTDHAPNPAPASARVRWWALGAAAPNWAFVNASRTPGPRGDRLLLEVANLGPDAGSAALRLEEVQPPRELSRTELALAAGETRRLVLELPAGAGAVRASLPADALAADNAVSLLSAAREPVTFDVRVTDPEVRHALEKALAASGRAAPDAARPQLVFVDAPAPGPVGTGGAWTVRLLREPEGEAFTGPFVLDRAHPLTDGLSLTGVVWGGGKAPLPGGPVVMAGNVPLLTDSELADGAHDVRLRLRPDLSTLLRSPNWPALVFNLVQWRGAHRPGLARANLRVGEDAVWTLAAQPPAAQVIKPGGETVAVPVHARRATVHADRPGVYLLQAGGEKAEFAANILNRDESDLSKAVTGRWGDEPDDATLRADYRDVTPWLVLLAAAVATLHVWALARRPGTGTGA